ncbi:hypothetical protein U1Q18_050066, partial [Sarracenia purpurea var. burkii]
SKVLLDFDQGGSSVVSKEKGFLKVAKLCSWLEHRGRLTMDQRRWIDCDFKVG